MMFMRSIILNLSQTGRLYIERVFRESPSTNYREIMPSLDLSSSACTDNIARHTRGLLTTEHDRFTLHALLCTVHHWARSSCRTHRTSIKS